MLKISPELLYCLQLPTTASLPSTLPIVGKFWIGLFNCPKVLHFFPFSIFRNSTSDTTLFLPSRPPAITMTLSLFRSVLVQPCRLLPTLSPGRRRLGWTRTGSL